MGPVKKCTIRMVSRESESYRASKRGNEVWPLKNESYSAGCTHPSLSRFTLGGKYLYKMIFMAWVLTIRFVCEKFVVEKDD